MRLIWATRGRTWGFRFLDGGGFPDPLVAYDKFFAGVGDEQEVYRRVGHTVVLRFPDPEGRKDAAGRVIPHEFVCFQDPETTDQIDSVEAGRSIVWPLVAQRFASVWTRPEPPSA